MPGSSMYLIILDISQYASGIKYARVLNMLQYSNNNIIITIIIIIIIIIVTNVIILL